MKPIGWILFFGGVGLLLAWISTLAKKELAMKQGTEELLHEAPQITKTAQGETILTMDEETQKRLGFVVTPLQKISERDFPNSNPNLREPPSIQKALKILGIDSKPQKVDPLPILPLRVVPSSAIVRVGGGSYVYLQLKTDQFVRHRINLDRLTKEGWLIRSGLSPGENIVVTGAEVLLSEEFKSEIQIEGEHETED